MRILYDSKNTMHKTPFGTISEGEMCNINIHIPTSCATQKAELYMKNEHSGVELCFEALKKDSDGVYDIYSFEFSIDSAGLYFYKFIITTTKDTFSLYKEGYSDTNIEEGSYWQLSVIHKDYSVPKSFQGQVMYQIFPDRFYREDILEAKGKLEPYWIHSNTDDIPAYTPDEFGKILNCDFYGGNLKGIEKKLPYLKSLGVSIIYLNPIFKAYSNHRYDTCDYKTIDPLLGDENDFKALCTSAHKLGIRIILDGVFSHTGSCSIYFDKNYIFGGGAYSDANSPYKSWYNFQSYPDKYDAWWGIETLPAVNELDPAYMDYIIEDDDSVIAHWLKLGADGFRLDVADELPDEFIAKLRERLKEIKPESYLIGEVWEDASNKISYDVRRKYFVASELDSVMNYVYKNSIIDFVCQRSDCRDFADSVMTLAENYPTDSLNSAMNSLSTHDTARIISCLSGAQYPKSRDEQASLILDDKELSLAHQRLTLAAFLQYVLPGNPCIYYGDEIGMYGFGDPFCRAYFKWDNINEDILELFKELGKIKNSSLALKLGTVSVQCEGDVLKIIRKYKSSEFCAIVNMSDKVYVTDAKGVIISHLASSIGGKIYVNKGGFVGI